MHQLSRAVAEALRNSADNGYDPERLTLSRLAEDMGDCDSDVADISGQIQRRHQMGDMQVRLIENVLAGYRMRTRSLRLHDALSRVPPEEWRAYVHAAIEGMGTPDPVLSHLTGSRATVPAGHDLPDGTDWDICVRVNEYKAVMGMLEDEGFSLEGGEHYVDLMNTSSFVSMRQGTCNIILTEDMEFYARHLRATRLAGALRLTEREHRLWVFKAILYDMIPGETSPGDERLER